MYSVCVLFSYRLYFYYHSIQCHSFMNVYVSVFPANVMEGYRCGLHGQFINKNGRLKPKFCRDRGGQCTDLTCQCCECKESDFYDVAIELCSRRINTTLSTTHQTPTTKRHPTSLSIATEYVSNSSLVTLVLTKTTQKVTDHSEKSESSNVIFILLGVIILVCLILAVVAFVFLRRRKRQKQQASDVQNKDIDLSLKSVQEPGYEQLNRANLDSPAYAYLETQGDNEYLDKIVRTPSSPPYSYVDSNKINKMLEKRKPNENEEVNRVGSPVYFVVEHENDHVYDSTIAATTKDEARLDEGRGTLNDDDPCYLELECDDTEVELNVISAKPDASNPERYKELLYSPSMNPYQELLKEDDEI